MADVSLEQREADAVTLLRRVVAQFSPVVFANSLGAEDMVLTHLIARERLALPLLTIDTGRLPPETYALMGEVEKRYGLDLGLVFPERTEVEALVQRQGINGFYGSVEQRKACCQARKVAPLQRALEGKRAWVTGLRAAQSPTRSELPLEAHDPAHGLMKFNPLAAWSDSDVWDFLDRHQVPRNALHAQGYPSIGCAPCTRAIQPGEDIRAGRWWWENPESKECGLHVVDGRLQRIKPAATAAAGPFHS
jgi:phosphoadenosine phosphosulfate reductase